MTYKQQLYTQERTSLQEEIDDSQTKAAAFVRRAQSGGEDAHDAQRPSENSLDAVTLG